MIEPQSLDLTFTGLGRTPNTYILSGSAGDDGLPRFVDALSRTERAVLGVLCDQITAEIQRHAKENA